MESRPSSRFGSLLEGVVDACLIIPSVKQEPWSKEDRRALSQAAKALSEYLDAWDPLGVYADSDGPPPGEYDDLTWPLMRLLVDGASVEALAFHLHGALLEQYDTTMPNTDDVAGRLRAWWDENRE